MRAKVFAMVPLAATSLACGGIVDEIGDAIEDRIAEVERREVAKVEAPEGQLATDGTAELPETWPADVPLPESVALNLSTCTGPPEQQWFTCLASGASPETPEALQSFYVERMTGWTPTVDADLGTTRMATFARGPETVAVSLARGEGVTAVAVTYTRQ